MFIQDYKASSLGFFNNFVLLYKGIMGRLFKITIRKTLTRRLSDFYRSVEHPLEAQQKVFYSLIQSAKNTRWGRMYNYKNIHSPDDFRQKVPLQDYVSLAPLIEQTMKGQANLLWPGKTRWFAKSSGTTSGKSKFIPVTRDALYYCHYKAGRDLLAVYLENNPDTGIYKGNGLILGGSHQINSYWKKSRVGDLSAVLQQNLPFWTKLWQQPGLKISLMEDWEEKINLMAKEMSYKNITHITGVPTWTLVLAKKILAHTGKSNLLEVWPHLELYVHGGVSFKPYREIFKKLIPSENMYYLETYNASEGFFGFQNEPGDEAMVLLTDHGIYYEFIPAGQIHKDEPEVLPLEGIKPHTNYAMVISTNSGLWRYKIGDTVSFSSTNPYKFIITGRTRHFINAFGEELIVENAEKAVAESCRQTGAILNDFTAGPVFFSEQNNGAHEWIIEFIKPPEDIEKFAQLLDENLKKVNSDYEAKRFKDMALRPPVLHIVPEGTFYKWMKIRGKLGGQNKVPRLCNDRKYLDDILNFIARDSS